MTEPLYSFFFFSGGGASGVLVSEGSCRANLLMLSTRVSTSEIYADSNENLPIFLSSDKEAQVHHVRQVLGVLAVAHSEF